MDITDAFNQLQSAADADPDQVKEARNRRDTFRDAFESEDEVIEVIPSGSLARSTQRDPINDVDLVIVFDPAEHPDWGQSGSSAGDALDHLQKRVKALLGESEGSAERIVRRADARNHAVKCFLDDPGDPDGFTVDVTPALRHDGHLLIPESKSSKWIETDPEYLIDKVARRQRGWDKFRPLVRILKMWNKDCGAGMKSLTVEVLALENLPAEPSRGQALYRFFTAAETAIEQPVEDPAGLCGPIQPGLDIEKAKEKISEAASNAWRAVNAEDSDKAACFWRRVFGDAFPEPEGGCASPDADDDGASARFGIGTGAVAGAGIGIDEPRPVRDAPQG